jgi:hypothetical protein
MKYKLLPSSFGFQHEKVPRKECAALRQAARARPEVLFVVMQNG